MTDLELLVAVVLLRPIADLALFLVGLATLLAVAPERSDVLREKLRELELFRWGRLEVRFDTRKASGDASRGDRVASRLRMGQEEVDLMPEKKKRPLQESESFNRGRGRREGKPGKTSQENKERERNIGAEGEEHSRKPKGGSERRKQKPK